MNPHATAELDEVEEDSDSEVNDIFKNMQKSAAKSLRKKAAKTTKPKKKKVNHFSKGVHQ